MKKTHIVAGYPNRKLVQSSKMFSFSVDTLVLAGLTKPLKKYNHILDIGTNNAILPILMSTKISGDFTGVEIQREAIKMANENVSANKLEDKIKIVYGDIRSIELDRQWYDLIICNPPFFSLENIKMKKSAGMHSARHEINLNLKELCAVCQKYSRDGTMVAFVHRASRAAEVISAMRDHLIEPKLIRFVHTKAQNKSLLFYIMGKYRGKPGLDIPPPLIIHNEDGSYTEEAKLVCGYR